MRNALIPIVAAVHAALGLVLLLAGAYLASLGGSCYYVITAILLIAIALLLFKRNRLAFPVFAALGALTLVWSLWEVGGSFWGLCPGFSCLG